MEGHGIVLGDRADLVIWDAAGLDEAVGALAPRAHT